MAEPEQSRRRRDRFFPNRRKRSNGSAKADLVVHHGADDSDVVPDGGTKSPYPEIITAELPSRRTDVAASKQTSTQEHFGTPAPEGLLQQATRNQVTVEVTLWALAYKDLRGSNPELVKEFERLLGIRTTGSIPEINDIAHKALEELEKFNASKEKLSNTSGTIRKYFQQAVKVVIASKDFIAAAVAADPHAAIAWTGVSLLLPLLLSTSQENEAAIKGLDYIAHLIMVYRWQEKHYLLNNDAVTDFKDLVQRLYTKILEYEATLLVHMHKNLPKRWARNVSHTGDWTSLVESIRTRDIQCRELTNVIENGRTREWRDEERIWHDKFFQQPRQDEEKRCIRMLYTNYEAGKNLNPERISGTCEWFLNHTDFLTWRESQSSSLLWLSADPGCGKSVLSKYLVDREGEVLTVNIGPPTMCYFFFKDGDIDRNDATKAISALLHQLIIQQPHLYQYAKADFENKNEKFLMDFDALWKIFLNAATNADGHEVICVLDALDECQERSRGCLIAKLVHLYKVLASNKGGKPILKFLVTSRPDGNIVRDFKDLTETFLKVRLRGEHESELISQEIDLVIRHKVKDLARKLDLSKSHQEELGKELCSIPHRTYLWLYLTFDNITKKLELTKGEIAVITKTIPRNVDEAYTAILNKSPDGERARRLLHLVLAATDKALTLQEMNVAMVIDESCKDYKDLDIWRPDVCEDRIKNICGLFLSVVDSKVYLIHQTARDFLVPGKDVDSQPAPPDSSSTCWKNSFYPAQSNLVLAKICIWYLELRRFEEVGSAVPDVGWKEEDIRQWEGKYHFYSYTAHHWPTPCTIEEEDLPESALIKTVECKTCDTDYPYQTFRIWFDVHNAPFRFGLDSNGTILHASHLGHDAVVRLLLERDDIQADLRDKYGRTPFSRAAERGHEATVQLLLERDDVHADSRDDDGRTPLSRAAERGHEAVVQLLLKHNIEADSRDKYGRTPLSWAAKNGCKAVVQLLLKHNMEADSRDKYGLTPLSRAAERGHEAVVQLLLERDDVHADSRDDDGRTPLSRAAKNGYKAVVQLLLKHNIEADSRDKYRRTPLSWAAERGHEAVVQLLLKHNVEANSRDKLGLTPLSWAVKNGCKAVVQLLLKHIMEADLRDNNDRTPLSWAAESGWEAVIQLVLKRDDVQADSRDDNDHTPLWWATEGGRQVRDRWLNLLPSPGYDKGDYSMLMS